MTKQEEIRDGVEQILDLYIDEGSEEERLIKRADKILAYLQFQGVVIKVDRELPELQRRFKGSYNLGYSHCRQDAYKAGYVAVEPIRKEVI